MKTNLNPLSENEYNQMIDIFVESASPNLEEQMKLREAIEKYGLINVQEKYYQFLDVKQETKDNIKTIATLVNEAKNHKKQMR